MKKLLAKVSENTKLQNFLEEVFITFDKRSN
jgi:hypothetical protein